MSSANHPEILAAMEKLFTGALSPREAEGLYAHVRGCPSCERAYEKLARAESALFPGEDHAFNAGARDRVRERLFAAAAPAPARAWWRASGPILGSIAALAAAAFLFLQVPAGDGELRARGGDAVQLSPQTGVRVLRVFETEGGVGVQDLGAGAALVPGDRLKIMASNLDGRYRFATAAVLAPSGRELARVGPVEVTEEDVGLGTAIPVSESWPAGQLRVVAVFTAERPGDVDFTGRTAGDGEREAVRVAELRLGGAE